jgi:hypothetical protein
LLGDGIEEAVTPLERLFIYLFIYYIFGLLGDGIEEAVTPLERLFIHLFIYYIFGLLGDGIEEAVTPLELFHLGLPELNVGVLEKRPKKKDFLSKKVYHSEPGGEEHSRSQCSKHKPYSLNPEQPERRQRHVLQSSSKHLEVDCRNPPPGGGVILSH